MKLKIFVYFIFITACIIFSLYIRFPDKIAARYIENNISKINPSVKIKVEAVKPYFPFGIKAESILINYGGRPLFTLRKFISCFDLPTLYGKIIASSFEIRGFDGIISGVLRVSKTKPVNINIKTGFKNLKLKNINFDNSVENCSISGKLNGNITADIRDSHILKSKVKLDFSDLIFQFPNGLFSIKKYSFSTGKIKFSVEKNDTVKIEQCVIKGLQADIHLSGQFIVNKDLKQSSPDVKARIVLYPGFFISSGNLIPFNLLKTGSDKAVINVRIKGTVRNPVITMNQGEKQAKR